MRLVAENNIAYWHGASGDHAMAVRRFGSLARDASIMFGPGHVMRVAACGSAAHRMARHGQVKEGIRLLEDILVTGASDGLSTRDVLLVRNNRAFWIGESGDGARAREQFAMLLRELGPDDFYALATRNNLAYWSGFMGEVGRALDEYETLKAQLQNPALLSRLGGDVAARPRTRSRAATRAARDHRSQARSGAPGSTG
ncbi:hypothetical protein ACXET9_13055 [Brachybacterium sp. DNPG3]